MEVFIDGKWGTVCGDNWTLSDAQVVCRQLSYRNAIAGRGEAFFGKGTGMIWMDDVHCIGNETSLFECDHSPLGQHNCHHSEDASVICGGKEYHCPFWKAKGHVMVNLILPYILTFTYIDLIYVLVSWKN